MSADSIVMGYATAYELKDRKEATARTLRALAHIATQELLIKSGKISVKDAGKEIRRVIDTEQGFDPQVFAPVAQLLQGGPDAGFFLSTATRAGLAGTLAWATIGGPIGVGVAAALAAGSIVADALLSLPETQEGFRSVFPDYTDELGFSLTAWAGSQFFDLLKASPKVLDLSIELHGSGHLPIDPKRTTKSAVNSLPPRLKAVAEPHIRSTVKPSARETEVACREAMTDAVASIDAKTADLLKQLQNEKNAAVRQQREQAAYSEARYIAQEITGLGALGGTLFRAFGSPEVAQKLQGFSEVSSSAYLALFTPGLGPFAVAGLLVNAAEKMLNIFGQTPDPLVEALKPINQKLDIVLMRLDVIANNQRAIFQNLAEIYNEIRRGRVLIDEIRHTLSAASEDLDAGLVDVERQKFIGEKNELEGFIANHIPEVIAQDNRLADEYRKLIGNCVTWAADTSKDFNQSGNASAPKADSGWTATIRRRQRADRLIGVIPAVASALKVQLPSVSGTTIRAFAGPSAWAEGTVAFLSGRIRVPGVLFGDEKELCVRLYQEGFCLREAIRRFATPASLSSLELKLREVAGIPPDGVVHERQLSGQKTLVGQIYQAVHDFDIANVPREIESLPYHVYGVYACGRSGTPDVFTVNFEIDFFQDLIQRGILALEDSQPILIPSAGWGNSLIRIMKGSLAGQLLFPDRPRISIGLVNPRFFPAIPGQSFPPQTFAPIALQRRSQEIWLAEVKRPEVREKLPAAINDVLSKSKFDGFEFYGEVARLVATFVRWRAATDDSVEQLYLANSQGPFSIDEVKTYLAKYISNGLSECGNWPLEITQAFSNYIRDTMEELRVVASGVPESKSVLPIDETLRRLAGYMIAKKIDPPAIS